MNKLKARIIAFFKGSLSQRSHKALAGFVKTRNTLLSLNQEMFQQNVEAQLSIDKIYEKQKANKSVIDANLKVIKKLEDFIA